MTTTPQNAITAARALVDVSQTLVPAPAGASRSAPADLVYAYEFVERVRSGGRLGQETPAPVGASRSAPADLVYAYEFVERVRSGGRLGQETAALTHAAEVTESARAGRRI